MPQLRGLPKGKIASPDPFKDQIVATKTALREATGQFAGMLLAGKKRRATGRWGQPDISWMETLEPVMPAISGMLGYPHTRMQKALLRRITKKTKLVPRYPGKIQSMFKEQHPRSVEHIVGQTAWKLGRKKPFALKELKGTFSPLGTWDVNTQTVGIRRQPYVKILPPKEAGGRFQFRSQPMTKGETYKTILEEVLHMMTPKKVLRFVEKTPRRIDILENLTRKAGVQALAKRMFFKRVPR